MNSTRLEIRTEVRRRLNETDENDTAWKNPVLNSLIASKYSYWLKKFVSQSPENNNFETTATLATSGSVEIDEDFGIRHVIEVRDSTDQTPGVSLIWADSWDHLISLRRDSGNSTQMTGSPTHVYFKRTVSDHGDMTSPITGELHVAPTPSSTRTLIINCQLGPGSHMKHSEHAKTMLPDEVEACLVCDVAIQAKLDEGAPSSELRDWRDELKDTLMPRIFTATRSVRRGPGRIGYYSVD